MTERVWKGGCLCGAVRYEARGEPVYAGHCYCGDCRKASGSGFAPFMGFKAAQVQLSGETRPYDTAAANGNTATRSSCPVCGSLVMGGRPGIDAEYNIYAGSLDDPSLFEPRIAIFTEGRPAWAALPEHLTAFPRMPPQG